MNDLVSELNMRNWISLLWEGSHKKFCEQSVIKNIFITIPEKEKLGFSNTFSKKSQNKRYDNLTRIVPIIELWINEEISLKVCCQRTLPSKDN